MTNNWQQFPPDVDFATIASQHKQATTTTTDKVVKNSFDIKNYLDFSIPEGKTSRTITIRLLPVNIKEDGTKEYFQFVDLHNIPVNKELNPNKSGKKTYMCLNSTNTAIDHSVYGSKCPVCEAQQELWKKWHEETNSVKKKEILDSIKALNVRQYCIVRCIERGNEKDGPKFWRIPLRQDKSDAYHSIQLLAETRHNEGKEVGEEINIFSYYKGRDLNVTFSDGNSAPTIMDKSVSTPITKDAEELNKWLYDEKKWSDVFSTKPYDYLKIVFDGDVPWFDKDNKQWVAKSVLDSKKQNAEFNANEHIKNAEKQYTSQSLNNTQPVEDFSSSIEDDGLPF